MGYSEWRCHWCDLRDDEREFAVHDHGDRSICEACYARLIKLRPPKPRYAYDRHGGLVCVDCRGELDQKCSWKRRCMACHERKQRRRTTECRDNAV